MTHEHPRRAFLYPARLDKLRPVLVISLDARNAFARDVLVIPCSTRITDAPTHVRLRKGEGGIPGPSVLKCEQITTLRKDDLLVEPLGRALSDNTIAAVERAILRAIGVPAAEPSLER